MLLGVERAQRHEIARTRVRKEAAKGRVIRRVELALLERRSVDDPDAFGAGSLHVGCVVSAAGSEDDAALVPHPSRIEIDP